MRNNKYIDKLVKSNLKNYKETVNYSWKEVHDKASGKQINFNLSYLGKAGISLSVKIIATLVIVGSILFAVLKITEKGKAHNVPAMKAENYSFVVDSVRNIKVVEKTKKYTKPKPKISKQNKTEVKKEVKPVGNSKKITIIEVQKTVVDTLRK